MSCMEEAAVRCQGKLSPGVLSNLHLFKREALQCTGLHEQLYMHRHFIISNMHMTSRPLLRHCSGSRVLHQRQQLKHQGASMASGGPIPNARQVCVDAIGRHGQRKHCSMHSFPDGAIASRPQSWLQCHWSKVPCRLQHKPWSMALRASRTWQAPYRMTMHSC